MEKINMFDNIFKKVKYEFEVPIGDNCVRTIGTGVIYCPHFTNGNGYPSCELGFKALEKVNDGVRKPDECRRL